MPLGGVQHHPRVGQRLPVLDPVEVQGNGRRVFGHRPHGKLDAHIGAGVRQHQHLSLGFVALGAEGAGRHRTGDQRGWHRSEGRRTGLQCNDDLTEQFSHLAGRLSDPQGGRSSRRFQAFAERSRSKRQIEGYRLCRFGERTRVPGSHGFPQGAVLLGTVRAARQVAGDGRQLSRHLLGLGLDLEVRRQLSPTLSTGNLILVHRQNCQGKLVES